ncbi:MAG: DUF924 domain-containing protein [Betaproteobacteria bacterium]|nr:DUF924 domain-containing protein [Betaproteobacteria bacterium]
MEAKAQRVLDFWFGAPGSPQAGQRRAEWFRKSDAFDASIRERFLSTYEGAAAGGLTQWDATARELLALIVVLDQFPRNMFRGSSRAFAADAQALSAAERMVARGWDIELVPLERSFAYLPFEHAEDRASQERSMQRFGALAQDAAYADLLEWARKHYIIIQRFGRFPHRNAILGRVSTPEEIAFLAQPGSSF